MQDESCIAGHLGERAAREEATAELLHPHHKEQHDDAPAASNGAAHAQPAAAVGVAQQEGTQANGVAHEDSAEVKDTQGVSLDKRDGEGSGSSGGSSGASSDSNSTPEEGQNAVGDNTNQSRYCHPVLAPHNGVSQKQNGMT